MNRRDADMESRVAGRLDGPPKKFGSTREPIAVDTICLAEKVTVE
jgi:hypothetical protein